MVKNSRLEQGKGAFVKKIDIFGKEMTHEAICRKGKKNVTFLFKTGAELRDHV